MIRMIEACRRLVVGRMYFKYWCHSSRRVYKSTHATGAAMFFNTIGSFFSLSHLSLSFPLYFPLFRFIILAQFILNYGIIPCQNKDLTIWYQSKFLGDWVGHDRWNTDKADKGIAPVGDDVSIRNV